MNLRVVDLFAGAGGFGLGFRLAGYTLSVSLEIDRWAADTLRGNNPDTLVIEQDVREFGSRNQIRRVCPESPDVLIGGPPCQGFSIAGPAQSKDPTDPRNSLFMDFARWVEYLQPTVFVMENVRGILWRRNAKQQRVLGIVLETFIGLGYDVEVWELDAAAYGVPQSRERVFIAGNRLGGPIGVPVATHRVSGKENGSPHEYGAALDQLPRAVWVWDAISDLPRLNAGQGGEEQSYTRPSKTPFQEWARRDHQRLYNHVAMNHTDRVVDRFKQINWRQSVRDVPDQHGARKRNGGGKAVGIKYDSNNRRLHPFRPSYTIPAHFYSSFVHPYQHRNITAREAARIQSFPDWYRFMGKRTVVSRKLLERTGRHSDNHLSQYNQIGNAVPPLLAKAIAQHILDAVRSHR
jgi:DNA (cytosine-5)-methyltransferase 1